MLVPLQRVPLTNLNDSLLQDFSAQLRKFYTASIALDTIAPYCWNVTTSIREMSAKLELMSASVSFSFITIKPVNVIDFEEGLGSLLASTDVTVFAHDKQWRFRLMAPTHRRTFKKETYQRKLSSCQLRNNRTTDTRLLSLSKLSSCRQLLFSADEIYTPDNSSLCINVSNMCLSQSAVEMNKDGGAFVCLDDYLYPKDSRDATNPHRVVRALNKKAESPLFILFVFCSVVSILCLIITIIVYALITDLRNVTGNINVVMVSVVTVAQFLHVITYGGLDLQWICATFAVVCHCAWLIAFCSINASCFYLFLKYFGTKPIKSENDGTETQTKIDYYYIWIFAVPSIIIILNILINIAVSAQDASIGIGYGGEDCELTSYITLWLTLVTPLGLTVIASATFYLTTCGGLQTLLNAEKRKNNSRHFVPYVIISLILVFMWTLKIAHKISMNPVTEYVFSIVNGMVGMCVMVILLWDKEVLRLIKEFSFRHSPQHEQEASNHIPEAASSMAEPVSPETEANTNV